MQIRRQTTKEKQQNKIVVLIYLLQILSVCLIYNIFYKQINNAENEWRKRSRPSKTMTMNEKNERRKNS